MSQWINLWDKNTPAGLAAGGQGGRGERPLPFTTRIEYITLIKQQIMNKADLVNVFSERAEIPQCQARLYLNVLLGIMEETLKKEPIMLQGFGTFERWEQTERPGRNPRTGVSCRIPARTSVKFKAGKYLLAALNACDE